MKLDAVYTWVDPTRLEWAAERQQYLQRESPQESPGDLSRHHSFDEIKYSLRSLFQTCNFIDRVFIVSNRGSRPQWLAEDPRIVVVDDRSILPAGSLVPNYNSNAIESCLHRIPALSPTFLYLNDDFFITKKLTLDDLIDPSSRQFTVFMESDWAVRLYNQTLSAFLPEIHHLGGGAAKARRYTYSRLGLKSLNQVPIGHCPRLYEKNRIAEFERVYAREIKNTRQQRFRTVESFCFCDAYAYHFERSGAARFDTCRKTRLITFTGNALFNQLQVRQALKNLDRYHFLAILDVRMKINPRNIRHIQHFLQQVYPDKNDFEV